MTRNGEFSLKSYSKRQICYSLRSNFDYDTGDFF